MMRATILRESTSSAQYERPMAPVSMPKAFLRSLRPLRVISDKTLHGPFTHRQFVERTTAYQRLAAASDIRDKTVTLWRLERLGFSYCRHGQGSLDDDEIPVQVQPILHVGLGIAATESAGFSAEKTVQSIEPRVHADFREYAYEAIGCIWAAYTYKLFQLLFRVVSRSKIVPCKLPEWTDFIGSFTVDQQRLISHGYGRTLYLKQLKNGRAIRTASRLDGLDTMWAIRGIAFAYAMINHVDLYRVLDGGNDLEDPETAHAFDQGLMTALTFWDWTFPGFLDGLAPRSERQEELMTAARQVIDTSRAHGASIWNWLR